MVTNTSGKKKTAIARATVRDGDGRVRIDSRPVELVEPELARLKMLEPFRIADDVRDGVDIEVSVQGGGISGQADAVRTAIARGLVQDPEAVLDELGVDRHCCRRMLVSHKDLVDIVAPYQ